MSVGMTNLSLSLARSQLRDVRLVAGKLRVVLVPRNTSEETLKALRDCASGSEWTADLLLNSLTN